MSSWRIENAVDGETSSNKTSCLSLTSCLGNPCVPPFIIDKCRSKPLGISCVACYMYGLLEALPRLTPKWASCIHSRSWPLTNGLVLQQFDLDLYCFVGKETMLLGPGLFSCAFSFLFCFILFCLVLSLFFPSCIFFPPVIIVFLGYWVV